MSRANERSQRLLKMALTGNALFSVMSGLAVLLANRWLVRFLGLPRDVSLVILGVSLIVYSVVLWLNARRLRPRITDAWVAVAMDIAWVAGSYIVIFVAPLSLGGKWVVALVAELVLAFAIAQWLGIRKIRKSEYA
jgi:hypothetical protein